MDLTRRQFLTGSAVAAGGAVGLTTFGFDMAPAYAAGRQLKILRATETRTVCPYCAVGCSMIAYSMGDKALNSAQSLVHIEGDPDSPINGGTLCPKGASTLQLAVNEQPGASTRCTAAPGAHRVGAHLLGRRHGPPGPAREGRPGQAASPRRTTPATRSTATTGFALRRRGHHQQRGGLPHRQAHPRPGDGVPRTTGPSLTRSHGGQFGRLLRSRGHDQPLARFQEQRRHPGHRGQSGREPPLRLEVGPRRARRARARRSSTSTPASPARRPSPTCTPRSAPAPTSPSSAG